MGVGEELEKMDCVVVVKLVESVVVVRLVDLNLEVVLVDEFHGEVENKLGLLI